MALGKLLKGGSLVLAGALVGGLLSYSSKKTEIVAGIDDIANTAIVYKTQAKKLSTDKEDLEKSIDALKTQIKNLTTEKEKLENQSISDANKINELTAKIEEKDAKIKELNNMIAFKDMLLQTTYEEAMRLEDKVADLTKQLEASKNDSQLLLDKANEEIEKANQDQLDILDAVNQAKEKINNN